MGSSIRYLGGRCNLPPEMVKVDLEYKLIDESGNIIQEEPLELWAGFVGLAQNNETMALCPKIGWMIRKKFVEQPVIDKGPYPYAEHLPVMLEIEKVPEELFALKKIDRLELKFNDKVTIPEELGNVQIRFLKINGKTSLAEIFKILKLFPKTLIKINKSLYFKNRRWSLIRFFEGYRYINWPIIIVEFIWFIIEELFKAIFRSRKK